MCTDIVTVTEAQDQEEVVRAMALGEVRLRDWWRVLQRELGACLALGAILGSIGMLRIAVWQLLFHLYGEHWVLIGLTVGLALVGVVLWGTLSGSMLPFVLRRFGLIRRLRRPRLWPRWWM